MDPYFDGDDPRPQSDRLQILTPKEYELLWGLPQFSSDQRNLFFALTPRNDALVRDDGLHAVTSIKRSR